MPEEKKEFKMSLRLSLSRGRLLEILSARYDVTKTAIISLALQEYAEKRGIPMPIDDREEEGVTA